VNYTFLQSLNVLGLESDCVHLKELINIDCLYVWEEFSPLEDTHENLEENINEFIERFVLFLQFEHIRFLFSSYIENEILQSFDNVHYSELRIYAC